MSKPTPRPYCKEIVFSGARWDKGGHQCSRKAIKNDRCRFHQPEAIEARRQKLAAKWAAQRAENDYQWKKEAENHRRLALLPEVERVLEEATKRSDFEPRSKPSWYDAATALLAALKENHDSKT